MYEPVRDFYMAKGFGGRKGFGKRPAVLVIDLARAWIDESSPLGSRNLEPVVANTAAILDVARANEVPVFFTIMAFDPAGIETVGPVGRKVYNNVKAKSFTRGTKMVEVDPRLNRQPDEIVIEKPRGSAFWESPLQSYLIGRDVDTVIVTGCSTSGCVRSTSESAHNLNYHVIVAAEAVGDRHHLAHECNLTDIDLRFGDVTPVDEVIRYIRNLPPAARR
ncbi:MAG: isochorismatase family protein [Alphaproteobacteria bacterium]|nr:isochorismatase family protein [Alphaproteobacteria bacterium]